ncbi:hypothetical protein AKJ51_02585 [candidate division MSBL1 archaeon SCGC-AAA382A20]|uniref:DNA-directed RNA polymerase subunit Rpo3 n=1 Tax=candidate division MSBL1 archaeon SCGC-AAA382A20 TaxID=1698280 RepID=A0A133VKC1_9EURY|nr:hypothetical protein AKJ51_02585 [candidate division MSBL1 archaeon SCGC-AAA382A20]
MEGELIELKDGVLRFLLSGTTPEFANSIRRTILQGIPIMAVNEIEVTANDAVVSDEILAHRLGQLPIRTSDGYLLPSECDCREGRCSNCSVTFDVSEEGPKVVRAKDLKSSDPEAIFVQEEAPIVRLEEGQKIELTAIARLGFGKEHANWQPAIASYKYMPVINIDQEARDDWTKCIDACPEDILKVENGKLEAIDVKECTLCEACTEACPDAIEVKGDSTKFIFRIESTGSLTPEEAVNKALEVMRKKCKDFSEQIERFE